MQTFSQFEASLTSKDELMAFADSEEPKSLLLKLHEAYYLGETDTYEELLENNQMKLDYLKLTDGDYQVYLSLMEQRDYTLETDMKRYGTENFQRIRKLKFEELNKILGRLIDDSDALESINNFVKYGGLNAVEEADFKSQDEFHYDHIKELMADELPTIIDEVEEIHFNLEGNPFTESHLEMKMVILDEQQQPSIVRNRFLAKQTKDKATVFQMPHTKGAKNSRKATDFFAQQLNKKTKGKLSLSVSRPLNHPKAKGYVSHLVKLGGKNNKPGLKSLSGGATKNAKL